MAVSIPPLREPELRRVLDRAVRRLRASLNVYPAGVTEVPGADLADVNRRLDDAHAALIDAADATTSLAGLTDLSEEAVLLVTTSRMALRVVREVLTLLSAELDSVSAA